VEIIINLAKSLPDTSSMAMSMPFTMKAVGISPQFIMYYALIFLAVTDIISCLVLTFSSKWLIDTLSRVALFLKMKEFVVGFFIMAFAASIPNFFVGIISALNKVPQLSFGDVTGGNIIDLSLVIGLAALLSRGGLSAQSRTVQGSAIFTIFVSSKTCFMRFI